MTGAMAGTATFHFRHRADRLRVVTLTVNNLCNLRCPHCYLQYDGEGGFASVEVLDSVIKAPFEHLAIVGKEPLVNKDHADACARLVVRAKQAGKTVSLITNGLNLHLLAQDALQALSWIDVSLDGGQQTYGSYRGPSFDRLIRELSRASSSARVTFNALHTLSSWNVANIDDMVIPAEVFPFERIVFSMYIETRSQGRAYVNRLAVQDVVKALGKSQRFMESSRTFALLGVETLPGQTGASARALLDLHGLAAKTLLIEDDPLLLGILRVTYDGLVLTPLESLHTDDYRQIGRRLTSPCQLAKFYRGLTHARAS